MCSTNVLPPHAPCAGLKPLTLGGMCSSNVLLQLAMSSTPSPASGWIQTSKLRIMSCCSTDELQPLALPCVSHFLASAAGHEPSTMG